MDSPDHSCGIANDHDRYEHRRVADRGARIERAREPKQLAQAMPTFGRGGDMASGARVRVGISGSYGGMNLGDEAILQTIIAQLRRSVSAEVTVFSRDADDSLSLLYWMQTEAPRLDGGLGYPGLRMRPDIVGSNDGLAKHVYVRESRRIRAEFTVLEQHVGVDARRPLEGAETFNDSVGIGSYRIDLHPSTKQRTYVDISSWPFQIPLGALIPIRAENLLPASKNIGVTHITNGCYRLHPVEWNIGEAAGALAGYCISRGLAPRQVRNVPAHLVDFQCVLRDLLCIELYWPDPRATAR
jgi:hypothetical protein